MASSKTLTWFAARRCWKKKIDGKVYYFGPRGINKSDREGYRQAVAEYEKLLEQHEQAGEVKKHLERIEAIKAQPMNKVAENIGPDQMLTILAGLEARQAQHVEAVVGADGVVASIGHKGQLATPRRRGHRTAVTTIGDLIDQYLKAFRAQVNVGNRSRSRYEPLRVHLEKFKAWPHAGQPVGELEPTDITRQLLSDWHTFLVEQIFNKQFSAAYAHDILGSVKQLIRWAWENELCNLPRNLGSKLITIPVPAKRPQHMSVLDIGRILAAATERTQLYILLALNSGMTAKDISDLDVDELDLAAGGR